MIKEFVKAWGERKGEIEAKFKQKQPDNYKEIVKSVVEILSPKDDDYEGPDPDRIHEIDDGDYQGTLLFVIAKKGYQPSDYWFVKVGYGSCSGCDTLEGIKNYSDEPPTEDQIKDYMTLALHIVQGIYSMQTETEPV